MEESFVQFPARSTLLVSIHMSYVLMCQLICCSFIIISNVGLEELKVFSFALMVMDTVKTTVYPLRLACGRIWVIL